jgi:hypothetical protein
MEGDGPGLCNGYGSSQQLKRTIGCAPLRCMNVML